MNGKKDDPALQFGGAILMLRTVQGQKLNH
jgi:hypothetical protein